MMPRLLFAALLGCGLAARAMGLGVDSGYDATELEHILSTPQDPALRGEWVRIRGLPDPAADPALIEGARTSLRQLRSRGMKTCILLRLSTKDWKIKYLPEDLREAHERGFKLSATYGGLVDAWEIDNEPDLGFVPELAERYAAYLKATYLGLKSGGDKPGRANPAAIVIMGSLGLPPGPWLERFANNDGFAYTDGFNYHYYGYAGDFTGVYRQHEAAALELSTASTQTSTRAGKSLPIFITELGYGMLGKEGRDTKDGRLRQWRWFKSVGEQATSLHIEAPLAFYLRPYLEYDTLEFGLTASPRTEPPHAAPRAEAERYGAGGIRYAPDDFGSNKPEPWMEFIGRDVGGNQSTPALAQWLAERGIGTSRPWSVNTHAPSPIVLDFIPKEGLSQIKRYNGHFVTGRTPEAVVTGENPAAVTKPISPPPKPQTAGPKPMARAEELMIHVRTQNGNLYEVYPTRLATPEWQNYLESQRNFTMSFYGRATLPWRFKDNRPMSLVVVMYPKQLPATYDFRKVRLIELAAASASGSTPLRHGKGTIILYNFSAETVAGRLILPAMVKRVGPAASAGNADHAMPSVLTLPPYARCEVPVGIQLASDSFDPVNAPVSFMPDDAGTPVARFMTAFIPDIGGANPRVTANLLAPAADDALANTPGNRSLVAQRPRAAEEAPMTELPGSRFLPAFFSQTGATVTPSQEGFSIAVTATPPGKPQRIEVEIPWPDGLEFAPDTFLSFDFRIR